MVRTMIGPDSTGAGCLKITKSNADDPRTTPDSQRSKFLYNSKYLNMEIADITVCNTFGGSGIHLTPAGATRSNFETLEFGGSGESIWIYDKSFFPKLRYNVPLFDWKQRKGNGSIRYNQNMVDWEDKGKYRSGRGGSYFTGNRDQGSWLINASEYPNGTSWSSDFCTAVQIDQNDDIDAFNPFSTRYRRLVVWDLPGDSTPIADAPNLAPNGTKAIRFASNAMKIAKPGYSVDAATYAQLAFDSTRLPVKVIRAADIALPSGQSFYECGFPVTDNVALDVHFYTGSTIMYPNNPVDLKFGAEYWFDGTRIYFDATQAMRARFMLYLEDNSAPTSGTYNVLREFNDGTQDVVQFLRPGAANPPSWADIIIDTRWPQVQILAEGYFNVTSGNGNIVDIPFDGTGMFPMVKYMTYHGGGSNFNTNSSWQNRVRMPFLDILKYGYQGQSHTGNSTYCELTANNARFRTFRGNVGDYYEDDNFEWQTDGADPPLGIRYYIFGIPA
ncbi:hypothetical protein [Sinorhizobium meliloti]|uniref:hypothetical protein n=1 Tax=Rhizobium meliloti TaxID=382 RepID=UPI000FDA386E|nr:hypothetical protein [Sinorhizobium meliloti]RVE90128.1 hypothetical protein CN238_12015 [Sinorhizobium meliloti]RVH19888.1 hypothetical protein CN214_32975 [Sinorhizobium meliloti]